MSIDNGLFKPEVTKRRVNTPRAGNAGFISIYIAKGIASLGKKEQLYSFFDHNRHFNAGNRGFGIVYHAGRH